MLLPSGSGVRWAKRVNWVWSDGQEETGGVFAFMLCGRAQRRAWCREVWVRRAGDYCELDVLFAIGDAGRGKTVRIDDLLLLPVEDTYRTLPQKTVAAVRTGAGKY